MRRYGDDVRRWLQSIRALKEKSPYLVELCLIDGEEVYLVKECEGYIGCSDRNTDSPHEVYSICPLSPGRFFLHRFTGNGVAYSGLYEGNHKEIRICKRSDEKELLAFFYQNQMDL